MSDSNQYEWAGSPIYQGLNDISERLHDLQETRRRLREEEEETRTAIKQALIDYFDACHENDMIAECQIDMLNNTWLEINDDWYDMDPLKAVTLRAPPSNVISIVKQLQGKRENADTGRSGLGMPEVETSSGGNT